MYGKKKAALEKWQKEILARMQKLPNRCRIHFGKVLIIIEIKGLKTQTKERRQSHVKWTADTCLNHVYLRSVILSTSLIMNFLCFTFMRRPVHCVMSIKLMFVCGLLSCTEDIDPITDIGNKDDATASSGVVDVVASGQFVVTFYGDVKANMMTIC